MSLDEINKLIVIATSKFIDETNANGDIGYAKGYLDAMIDVRRSIRGIGDDVFAAVTTLGCAFPYA